MKGKRVIDQDILVRSVIDATSEVFSMMLDIGVDPLGVVDASGPTDYGLISLVGITGEWGGSGVFCCSPVLASILSARMLGGQAEIGRPVIDGEVLDVVAEITNMMIGNIKNGLEPVTGPLAISVPTVVHGRNFQFRTASGVKGTAVGFSAEGERFEVRVALAPASEQATVRSRIPVLGFAHM
jgi:chemotaxis protein CheX